MVFLASFMYAHCSSGGRNKLWCGLCSAACKFFKISLTQSSYLHLILLFFLLVSFPWTWIRLLWLCHLLIVYQSSLWLETCCSNLQCTKMFNYLHKMYLHQLLPMACLGAHVVVLVSFGCIICYSRHVAHCFTVFYLCDVYPVYWFVH